MGEKNLSKKAGGKVGSGILFIAACFVAAYILMEYHDSLLLVGITAVILLISAYLFLNALFEDKAKEWALKENGADDTSGRADGEFHLKVSKYMKDMESSQKELLNEIKKQNSLIEAQFASMKNNIVELSDKQVIQTKTLIKYNKENARQMAINERETLEHVMHVLKKTIEDNAGKGMVAAATVEPVMEELQDFELAEMPDLPDDDEFVMPELPVVDYSEEVSQIPVEEPVEEPVAEPEPEPAADPMGALASDPNAMMTPDDIAKLLESMGN